MSHHEWGYIHPMRSIRVRANQDDAWLSVKQFLDLDEGIDDGSVARELLKELSSYLPRWRRLRLAGDTQKPSAILTLDVHDIERGETSSTSYFGGTGEVVLSFPRSAEIGTLRVTLFDSHPQAMMPETSIVEDGEYDLTRDFGFEYAADFLSSELTRRDDLDQRSRIQQGLLVAAVAGFIVAGIAAALSSRDNAEIRQIVIAVGESSSEEGSPIINCVTSQPMPRTIRNSGGPFIESQVLELLVSECQEFSALVGIAFPRDPAAEARLDSDGDGSVEYECGEGVFVFDEPRVVLRQCLLVSGPGADTFRTQGGVVIERIDVSGDGNADFILAEGQLVELSTTGPWWFTSLIALIIASISTVTTVVIHFLPPRRPNRPDVIRPT